MQNTSMPITKFCLFKNKCKNYYCIIIAESKLAKIIRICEFTRAYTHSVYTRA